MPAYIKLCLDTWKLPFTILTYDNLSQYTDFDIEGAKRFTLPQIADAVRVHVLRDNGGYWLDADTIMLSYHLMDEVICGDPVQRTNSIGYLHAEAHSDMFTQWAEYQDKVIADLSYDFRWDVLGNRFTDSYLDQHREIKISSIQSRWPETYMTPYLWSRYLAYQRFYFCENYHLDDIEETDVLMLHNSWTPDTFKHLSKTEVANFNCTLSNILKEVPF